MIYSITVAVWRSGNYVCRIIEVTVRRVRLVLGWMTVFGRANNLASRHHRSNGDYLEGKRENYHVFSVQYSVQLQQLCTVQ